MNHKYKKILVIGGSGFLGLNLIETLVKYGYHVRVLDRINSKYLGNKVEFCEGDFTATHLLGKVIDGCDAIFHLASTTLPGNSNDDPMFDVNSNLLGTIGLLELAVRKNIKKFVFISSGGTVYGIPNVPAVSENEPTNPICSYGIIKLTIEKYLKLFNRLYGLNTCSLRLSNPYGKYQRTDIAQGAITVFCHKALKGETIEIWGDGSVIRDFIYINDAVNAMLKALEIDCLSEDINIGDGIGTNLNQIVTYIESVISRKVNVKYLQPRKFDVPKIVLDITKAKSILNWEPEINLMTGIDYLVEWQKQNNCNLR